MSAEIEIRPTTYAEWYALEEERDQLRAELDRLRSAPVEVGVPWISVEDRLPEDGQSVAFVTKCDRDPFYHGRVLGGRYTAGEFGGFSVPGLMSDASHWLALPPPPVALRSQRAAEGGKE